MANNEGLVFLVKNLKQPDLRVDCILHTIMFPGETIEQLKKKLDTALSALPFAVKYELLAEADSQFYFFFNSFLKATFRAPELWRDGSDAELCFSVTFSGSKLVFLDRQTLGEHRFQDFRKIADSFKSLRVG